MTDLMGMTVLYEGGQNPQVDIIAIHGLNGGSRSTWTYSDGGQSAMWLQDFLPTLLQNCRIMTYGFNADVRSGSEGTIRTLSKGFLENINITRELENVATSRPIIFVAHSLGGLIVKHALVGAKGSIHYGKIYTATYGILFFGTPHRGSYSANLAAVLDRVAAVVSNSTRSPLIEVLKTSSEVLRSLNDSFSQHRFYIVSFIEGLPTSPLGGLVVDENSAKIGLHEEFEKSLELNLNHRDLCKFPNNSGVDFRVVSSNIARLVQSAIERTVAAKRTAEYGLNSNGGSISLHVYTPGHNMPRISPKVPAQVTPRDQKSSLKPQKKSIMGSPTKVIKNLQALKVEKTDLQYQCQQLGQELSKVGKKRQQNELERTAFKARNREQHCEQIGNEVNRCDKNLRRLENERVELERKRGKLIKRIDAIERALHSSKK